nr:MAG TPA: hypothetical protein [Caudoviricetes sp.]
MHFFQLQLLLAFLVFSHPSFFCFLLFSFVLKFSFFSHLLVLFYILC